MSWTTISATTAPARLVKLGEAPDAQPSFTGVYLGTKPGPHRLLLRFEAPGGEVAVIPRCAALDRLILNDYRGVLVTLEYRGDYDAPAGHPAKRIAIREHLDPSNPEWLGLFPLRDLSRTERPVGNERALPVLAEDPEAPLDRLLAPGALAVLRERLPGVDTAPEIAQSIRWWMLGGYQLRPSGGLFDYIHDRVYWAEMTRPLTLDDLKGGWD